ncbi:MAG TPA: ABC transporter permease [Gemmataceae bacterium]|jgi:putative ABC transport system permease protein|nr:ABC transporter permease [Gemmataceae bacterium]
MGYALSTIWHERNRFLPAILAVSFSAVLIVLQTGLLLGLLTMMSTPVDKAEADIWIGYPGVRSVDLGQPIPEAWQNSLWEQPEVDRVETCVMGFAPWSMPASAKRADALTEVCMVIGTELHTDSIAVLEPLRRQPELLATLGAHMSVLIDESERERLGVRQVGDQAVIMSHTVHVVGFVHGLKSLGGPYVFCSLETAKTIIYLIPEQSTFVLAHCRNHMDAARVAQRLRASQELQNYPSAAIFTSDEFSTRSRLHWMTTTKAGLALAFTACLGLIVGAVVTSQTLYAATLASQREYATLRAMGIPRWRLMLSVLAQSFWVGLAGIMVAVPITLALAWLADAIGTHVRMPAEVVAPAGLVTLAMAIASGLWALRSLQRVDPAHNIR